MQMPNSKKKFMDKFSVPPIDRAEWKLMISGEIKFEFESYTLQVQLSKLQKKINTKEITMQDAVLQVYNLCSKYAMAAQADIKKIFKTW